MASSLIDFNSGYGLWLKWFLTYFSWWVIPLLFVFIYKKMLGKYPIDVVIYEKRGENLIKTNDMAGRFESPVACYKLKKAKDSIPIPQYDWVLQCMDKPTNMIQQFEYFMRGKIGSITLFKYSSKQYKPVKVHLDNGQVEEKLVLVTDKNHQPVYVNIYEYVNPKQSMSKINFEVIDWDDINHMTQELRAIAIRRSPILEGIQKWWPMIAVVLGIMALIIAGYYYTDIITSAKVPTYEAPTPTNTNKPTTDPNIPIISDLVPGT